MGWNPFEAIGDALDSAADFVGDVVGGIVKGIGKIVTEVVDFVVQPFMDLFSFDVPSPGDAQQAKREEGVLIQQSGSNVNIPVVYGYRKIAGTVVFVETGSTDNKYLWVAYAFCEGAIEGVREVFIDDTQLDSRYISQLNSGNSVDITTGRFQDRVKLQLWGDGYKTEDQYVDDGNNSILSESPSWDQRWTANGLVVLMARYEWKKIETQEDADDNPFTGAIPKLQISVLGRRVASLLNSSVDQYDYEGAGYTERYSTNPAEILLDYLRNPRYGKGLQNSEIDWDSWKIAAQKANTEVTYIANGIKGPILTANYVIDTGQTLFNNVKLMLTGMRAYMPYVQGKYKLKIEDAGNPTDITSGAAVVQKVFNKDNIVGDITFTGVERSAKYNQVVVKYVDPDNKWSVQEVVFPESESERLRLQQIDGGRENKKDMTLPGITNYAIARDFARLVLNKSRFQDSISFKANSQAFDLEPGDNVYVDANILKFGTDPAENAIPFRIVSIKLNNDYTFDIGCIRNPDFIYPYVTAGEIDTLIPPYIPKGADIVYPGVATNPPVGLVPPTNGNVGDQTGVPRPGNGGGETDPTDPTDGGGVGAPDGGINQDRPNNPAPEPPRIPERQDYVEIENVRYATINGGTYADITITQPTPGVYDHTKVWWKRNISSETVWESKVIDNKPGAGREIDFRIGPLIPDFPYSIKTRVVYQTGDSSKFVNTAVINVERTGQEDPQDFQQTVGSGWELNTQPVELRRNTYLRTLSARPTLNNGSPTDPRGLVFSIEQDIYNLPINGYIAGMNVYYKKPGFEYWTKREVDFDDSYTEGAIYEFTISDFGSPGTDQLYDFALRFRYTDNTESIYQYRTVTTRVETDPFGNPDFNPFRFTTPKNSGRETVDAFTLITVDNAPQGSVADPRDLEITFNRDFGLASLSRERILFWINEPDDPQAIWRGIRVYFRKITYEGAQERQQRDFLPVTQDRFGRYLVALDIEYDVEYEYVLVPIVSDGGERVEARQAWRGVGFINSGQINGRTPDWFERLNFQKGNKKVLLSEVIEVPEEEDDTSPLPSLPESIQVVEFNFIKLDQDSFSANPKNSFYELRFYKEHITDYTGITIYRRMKNVYSLNYPFTNSLYGYGPWERLEITSTNTDSNNLVGVNLRVPLSHRNFRSREGNITPENNFDSLYYDYDTDTFTPIVSRHDQAEQQFFIITNNSAGSSEKGLLLTGNNARVSGSTVLREIVKNSRNKPKERDPEDFNKLPSGLRRNLNEAYPAFPASQLRTPQNFRTLGYTPPAGAQ